jgi:hypothetical protein
MRKHKQKASAFTLKVVSLAKRMQKQFTAVAIAALLLMTLSFRVCAQNGEQTQQSNSGMFTMITGQLALCEEADVLSLLPRAPSAHRQELNGCPHVASRK